jgi:hypothetical protein
MSELFLIIGVVVVVAFFFSPYELTIKDEEDYMP